VPARKVVEPCGVADRQGSGWELGWSISLRRVDGQIKRFLAAIAIGLLVSSASIFWTWRLERQLSSQVGVQQRTAQMLASLQRVENPSRAQNVSISEAAQLMDGLSRAADAHKVHVIALVLDPSVNNGPLATHVLDMQGTYPAIKAMLAEAFNANDRVAVREFSLRRTNQTSDIEGRITFIVKTGSRP
jgi:hypothetical protein